MTAAIQVFVSFRGKNMYIHFFAIIFSCWLGRGGGGLLLTQHLEIGARGGFSWKYKLISPSLLVLLLEIQYWEVVKTEMLVSFVISCKCVVGACKNLIHKNVCFESWLLNAYI